MTYKEIYEKAANMLDRGKITLGDFNKMVEPLNSEVQSEITHEQAVEYLQSTGWMREHDLQMMLDGVHRLTAQPEPHWIPVTKEEMFKAGYDGREIIFKVDGRLFAIRELAQ